MIYGTCSAKTVPTNKISKQYKRCKAGYLLCAEVNYILTQYSAEWCPLQVERCASGRLRVALCCSDRALRRAAQSRHRPVPLQQAGRCTQDEGGVTWDLPGRVWVMCEPLYTTIKNPNYSALPLTNSHSSFVLLLPVTVIVSLPVFRVPTLSLTSHFKGPY